MTNNLPNRYLNGNMHPADALAAVREEIAQLKKIEEELRDTLLEQPSDRIGQMYVAEVVLSAQSRICQKKIRQLIGNVEKVKKLVSVTMVRVKKMEEEE